MTALCDSCGANLGWADDGHMPPVSTCRRCPPKKCADCGLMDHMDAPCSCWRSVADIPFADLKGLFAGSGLSLDREAS